MNTPTSFSSGRIAASKIATQGRVAAQLICSALYDTLVGHRPADRCIGDALRGNHQLGSRDRRVINFTYYAALRWWGWLRFFAPAAFVSAWEKQLNTEGGREKPIPLQTTNFHEWYPVLAAANLLENQPEAVAEVTRFWLQEHNVSVENLIQTAKGDISSRASFLPQLFPAKKCPELTQGLLVPEWTQKHVSSALSLPFGDLMHWLQQRPPVWLRSQEKDISALQQRLAADGIPCIPGTALQNSLQVTSPNNFNFRAQADFQNGCFEIQDAGAQAVGYICAPKPGQQWWDACAGGGGKTLHLAWLMQEKGSVLATDLRAFKLEELKLRARRAHFPNIRYKEWKGKEMPKFNGRFDGVLVDAPCTCSGTWRRNPGARWITAEHEIASAAALQLQILSNAAAGVKHGGILVYSTCSMFEDENNHVVKLFLDSNPDFSLVPFTCPLSKRANDGTNQIWPWDSDCDAMFTAKFIRK